MHLGMTMRRISLARQGAITLLMMALACCVAPPQKPAPRPAAPPPPPALLAAPPQQDWRDVPLTSGDWTWRAPPGESSLAQYGVTGQAVVFALRCDLASRNIVFSRAGAFVTPSGALSFTTSFGSFALAAGNGGGQPSAIVAQVGARDPRLDQLAFSRGRFLVNVPGQVQLVLPAWPEIARVIEDCRS